MPRWAQAPRSIRHSTRGAGVQAGRCAVGCQYFRRAQAFDFGVERCEPGQFHHTESAGRKIQPGKTKTSAGAANAGEHGIATFIEQRFIGDGAGRDDAHHLAFHRTLSSAGFAALLANGDGLSLTDQFHQVGIESHRRHARHGNRGTGRGATLRERDVQQLRGTARIVVEHFVEIAHAIEQQHIGMLCLDAQVLLHHGGVCCRVLGIHSYFHRTHRHCCEGFSDFDRAARLRLSMD